MADGTSELKVNVAVRTFCGFLEESPGVRSSTRLFAAILLALAAVVVGVIAWYVIYPTVRNHAVDSSVVGTLAGVLGALVLQGVVAIMKRGGGD
jgi:uncharacterized BrkB/YihY/UPF0761 family membrane protein